MNTTDTKPRDAYVIVCDETCGELYWSNDLGWTCLAEADRFSREERGRFNLPVGGSWMPLEIVEFQGGEA
jgi:hypothetical protein